MHSASHVYVVGSGLDPSVKASQRLFKSRKLLDLKERERFSAASDFSGVYGCGSGLVFALHVLCESALKSCPVLTLGACEYANSLSPVWVCMCTVSCPLRVTNPFPFYFSS